MMNFKEIVFDDIRKVFLNPEEFGEIHVIDGKQMPVIVDGMEVVERSKKQVEKGRIEAIFQKQTMLYVSKSEFGSLPVIGRQLKLDTSIYRVIDAIDEGGVYSITLGAVKT